MKILITGICGFVGSTLAKEWLSVDAGLEICGLDNLLRPGSEENRIHLPRFGIKLFHGDIRAASDFETLPEVDWGLAAASITQSTSGNVSKSDAARIWPSNLMPNLGK